jgi:hypothetical protein
MRNRENQLEVKVQRAQEKILGTKFCFACQKPRPIDEGKKVPKGTGMTWRCFGCINKQNPMGFARKEKE